MIRTKFITQAEADRLRDAGAATFSPTQPAGTAVAEAVGDDRIDYFIVPDDDPRAGTSEVQSPRAAARAALLQGLAEMPDEAFSWLVLACRQRAQPAGANTQVWPDGIGGFTYASRSAILQVRVAAETWIEVTP